MKESQHNILISKLDQFIRKYYLNQVVRGLIYFFGISLLLFVTINVLEHFGRYTTTTRTAMFFSFVLISVALLFRYVAWPLSKLFKLGKVINHAEAARIIGAHFSDVSDKLLNALQLLSQGTTESSLLAAAIEQKTLELSPVPFVAAVDAKRNYHYLKLALIPVSMLLGILVFSPEVVSESTERLVNYDKAYKVPAPFTFKVQNKNLKAEQFQDFQLLVEVNGSVLPNEVNLHMQGKPYRMQKEDANHFSYTFKNLQQSVEFFLEALGYEDETLQLTVLNKPVLLGYQVKLNYPAYLNKQAEVINNPGDLTIPAGTKVNWTFSGRKTDAVLLWFNKLKATAETKDKVHFHYARKFFVSDEYTLMLSNQDVPKGDSMHYAIQVIPDAYPLLEVDEVKDSINSKFIYLAGNATDDYGIKRVMFKYRFLKSANKEKTDRGFIEVPMPVAPDKKVNVNHIFNLYEAGFEAGEEIEYFFEAWDNDGVTGSKSSRSKVFSIKAPDLRQVKEQANAESEALQNKMEEALKESKELQEEFNKLKQKLKSQQPLTWEEKKRLEQLMEKQKDLQTKMQELQKDFKQKNQKEQNYKQESERILEKQEQLQKMYEQLMTEEMKQLMKQMEQMMKMQNKDLIKREMEKMEINNKDVEKELDRMLEMYKEMEVDKRREDALKELKQLAEEQRKLAEDKPKESTKDELDRAKEKEKGNEQQKNNGEQNTDKKDKPNTDKQEESGKKQDALNAKEEKIKQEEELQKKFEELQKDLRELEKKNQELENPKELLDTKQLEEQVKEKMQQSSEQMKQGKEKQSKQSMNEAADKMEEMEQKMQEQKEKEEEEEDAVDAQALREILENLIQLSKDQEQAMEDLKQITGYNPKFVELAQKQKIIKDNAKMIEDSLLSLSKRAPQVKSFINKEVTKMNSHLDKSNQGFAQRNMGEARTQQQYAMTRMNNLAVMLSESLKQMQQEMQMKQQSKSKGKGKPKPQKGNGKPSMSQLKKMQEEMNKQMKEGMNKNGTGEGGKAKMTSEQYARMAAQQMAIRQQMQKMLSEMDALEKEKMGGGKQLGDLQKLMEETEKDLVNKRLTQETLMRQQEILTRLLEHEKAEKKQEEEQKREAEKGKEMPRPSPQYLDKMQQKQRKDAELLQTVPAEMQPYYKQKAKEYLERVE